MLGGRQSRVSAKVIATPVIFFDASLYRCICFTTYSGYVAYFVPTTDRECLHTSEGLLAWWKEIGARLFPLMSRVAQILLSAMAGTGVLENHFSSASNIVTNHRTAMSPNLLEMILFLKASITKIPESIPAFENEEQLKASIPRRLSDKAMQTSIMGLVAGRDGDYNGGEDSDEELDEEELRGGGGGGSGSGDEGGGGGGGGGSGY